MVFSTDDGDLTTPDVFMEQWRRAYELVRNELREIELLIQQTTSEVERLAYRNTQASSRMRQIEAALDTVPREDIRETYTTVLDTQQRLFTMRGQLEKLQSDRRNRAEYLELLRSVLQVVDRVDYGAEPEQEVEPVQPLIVRIIEAQERERQRLSRQMHDGPAQSLTNLVLQAEICERLFASDPERASVELTHLKNSVAATFQKVKGFILSLRPMMLDDLGLMPTLRRYVDSFADNSGVATQLMFTGKEQRIVSHKEVTIFRIIQELLNNAQEYSHATSIKIGLDLGDDVVRVSVEDNGSGFDVDDMFISAGADRLGLATMRERVEMLGGQIEFDSGVGRGTLVSFELPVVA